MRRPALIAVVGLALGGARAEADSWFGLPTRNRALHRPGGGPEFLVPTPDRDWTSGAFGCVRSEGWQFHEGLDIRCLDRDHRGEPTDEVRAAADGTVVYVNLRSSLSTFGRHIVVRHEIEGLEVYSLYAHLGDIPASTRAGAAVRKGDPIAVMGRTSNTRQRITRERAHLHFEIGLRLSDRYPAWYARHHPGKRDDHGEWNGRNYLGIDPLLIYQTQAAEGDRFSLVQLLQRQRELCRVLVRDSEFGYVRRYRPLITRNPRAEAEGVAGYELSLNFAGLPYRAIPRAASEFPGPEKFRLVSVNETEQRARPCRRLVRQSGGGWELAPSGRQLLELLTF